MGLKRTYYIANKSGTDGAIFPLIPFISCIMVSLHLLDPIIIKLNWTTPLLFSLNHQDLVYRAAMAGWLPANHKSKRTDIDMGFTFSCKSGLDLMQNCDLPPPIKLFPHPVTKICKLTGQEVAEDEIMMSKDSEDRKLEILKALRLSQTRAREAERKCSILLNERDALSNLLLDESLRLFAYKQLVRLLEFRVSILEREQRTVDMKSDSRSMEQYAAVAFCLAIAGMGFAIGCSYIF